jgi:hypothetical protein
VLFLRGYLEINFIIIIITPPPLTIGRSIFDETVAAYYYAHQVTRILHAHVREAQLFEGNLPRKKWIKAFAHKKLVNNNNNAYSSFVFFVDSHSREKEGL